VSNSRWGGATYLKNLIIYSYPNSSFKKLSLYLQNASWKWIRIRLIIVGYFELFLNLELLSNTAYDKRK
jgi:hypothetical protein